MAQPGHVHRRDRRGADHGPRRRRPTRAAFAWLIVGLAVAHRDLRQPRRGGRRGPRQGAGRHPAQTKTRPDARRRSAAADGRGDRPGHPAALGDIVVVEAGEVIPGDGDVVEGIASRRRVGHHRRVRAGHPRVRRRPLGGHRRHQGAVGPDRRADHRQAGRDLHRPDDRAGRGRRPAEDAERDRAEHPARRPDDHLPARRGARCSRSRSTPAPSRAPRPAGRAAGLPDPDHDRRAAVGHRHRRHGPAGAAQRARDVGPRGRGRRRRQHPAARQDRHDHPRQPAGRRVRPGAGRDDAELADAAQLVQPRRRDARGPLDRRARQERVRACERHAGDSPVPTSCRSPPRPG